MQRCASTFFILLLCAIANANDGSGYMGVGGVVSIRDGNHPTIRLVDEQLHIKLPEGKVRVEYVFRNEGPATTAVMAFPEEGYMIDPGKEKKLRMRSGTLFDYFRSWVDGKRIDVKRTALDTEDDNSAYLGYEQWWVKRVPFAKNQTRRVVNEYQGGLGWGTVWLPEKSFSYTFRTGSTWKGGKIGRLRITIDARDLVGNSPITTAVFGKSADKTSGIWKFEATQYDASDDLSVRWCDGFFNFNVDGRPYPEKFLEKPDVKRRIDTSPIRRGSEVFVPVSLFSQLLNLSASRQGDQIVISGTGHTIVQPLNWKGGFTKNGRTLFPVRQVVAAFGGKSWWVGDRLYVRF